MKVMTMKDLNKIRKKAERARLQRTKFESNIEIYMDDVDDILYYVIIYPIMDKFRGNYWVVTHYIFDELKNIIKHRHISSMFSDEYELYKSIPNMRKPNDQEMAKLLLRGDLDNRINPVLEH